MKMSVFQDICYNKSFSQLAKESSFTFNLYRGRVDWKKLEELDVDRVIRDQDVELLNLYLSNITNCSLESEYDVKILDPNFIKLFRLAQLLIDFLLHCKKYLEHCIKVAHESLQASNKEVEVLRKQLQARKMEVKQLKKKFKEVKQQLLFSPGVAGPTFECSLCGKVFMSETFLHGHHSRRHQPVPHSLVLRPFNTTPLSPHVKIISEESEIKTNKVEEITSIKKKYQEEIEDMKKLFFAEIEKLKQNESSKQLPENIKVIRDSNEGNQDYKNVQIGSQEDSAKSTEEPLKTLEEPESYSRENDEKIKMFEDKRLIQDEKLNNHKKEKKDPNASDLKADSVDTKTIGRGGEEEWVRRLEEREAVWRARLADLDQQHKKQVQQLMDKLNSTQQQGQETKKELETRLEEIMAKFEQSQRLLESKLGEAVKNVNEKIFNTSVDSNREREVTTIEIKTPSKENNDPQREDTKQAPPFQKRRAFVSQKTKTIEDIFEIPESKEIQDNLVQVLHPENDSDLENVSLLTQNSTREKINKDVSLGKTTPAVNITKDKTDGVSMSKNQETIIAKLLEEERMRYLTEKKKGDGDQEVIEEEDSTFSGSVSETESELVGPGEGGRGERRGSQSSDDQLLREEADLAQQSLQSMEALLAANPGILQQLRSDLAGLVGRRLQGLGIDPAWRGLPPATYRDKMAALAHQRNITAKSHPVYFTLRDKLRADAEAAVAVRSKVPRQRSAADSLLSRLRSKAAQVISAARFTRRLGSHKMQDSVPRLNLSSLNDSKPLAASSPQLTNESAQVVDSDQVKKSIVVTKVLPTAGESFSLSSSTDEEDEVEDEAGNEPAAGQVSVTSPQTFKSALRHTVSTSNLAKKKVLFVDQAFNDSKRSQSENTMVARENVSVASRSDGNVSVANLVQEIQQQLSTRSGKPLFSIDTVKQPDPMSTDSEIPLSHILPLTRSGREILESQSKNSLKRIHSNQEPPAIPELKSPRTLEPLSQILQRVPASKPGSSTSLGRKPDLLEWSTKSQLQPPKLSPAASLSSIGSSLLDLSASPRASRRPVRGSLEWDLQDLEDNMKD